MIIADAVTHINAGTQILGMVWAWGQGGNLFGNGNATIRFSSAVPAKGEVRVLRGGNRRACLYTRSAYRDRTLPSNRRYDLGFRVALR